MNAPVCILVVDDEEPKRAALARILSRAGYEVRQAAGGREALEMLGDSPAGLVLLDVEMPGLDGQEVCRRIKAGPALQAVPVLHLSAHRTTSQHRAAGLDSGADGYVVWPVDPEEPLAWGRALLRIGQTERALRAANEELRESLAWVKTLSGLLPICSGCKKTRNDAGYWEGVESYIQQHSDAQFTHGYCPGCISIYFSEVAQPGQAEPPAIV